MPAVRWQRQAGGAQAEAIRLVKIDGLSIQEASALCGQSQSLVKINVHRGLKRLVASCSGKAVDTVQAA